MQALKCTRCGHKWYPRQFTDQGRPVEPKRCPACGSPYWKTPRLSKTQKAELVRIMIKHTNLKDPEVYRDIEWSNLNPDGAVIVKSVADQQDFFVKMGRVEKPVPIEKVVDNSFADHAAKVLGPYRR